MKLLLVFGLIILNSAYALNCDGVGNVLNCDFYQECIEAKIPCGSSGYALGYGEKYCQRFLNLNSSQLSSRGLEWRDSTLKCLQVELSVGLNEKYLDQCREITKYAFDTHPGCYTTPGQSICDLNLKDWQTIISVPDATDLISLRSSKQVIAVVSTCSTQILGELNSLQSNSHLKSLSTLERQLELQEKLRFIDKINSSAP